MQTTRSQLAQRVLWHHNDAAADGLATRNDAAAAGLAAQTARPRRHAGWAKAMSNHDACRTSRTLMTFHYVQGKDGGQGGSKSKGEDVTLLPPSA